MKSKGVIEFCKYYDNGNCPHRAAYMQLVEEAATQGMDLGGLQPKCPRDAQRNKRGILSCTCERSERL